MSQRENHGQDYHPMPRTVKTSRRMFLQTVAAPGISIPFAWTLLGSAGSVLGRTVHQEIGKPEIQQPGLAQQDGATQTIVRSFADPYLEILRLLREAAEIEHALMVQYLYAAFSVKPSYRTVAGYGDPNAHDLLGVAVQEMQHLGAVNRLLVDLGSVPHLERQDFPFEPDIYPFAFKLEPLSRQSLAKYVYCEAPVDAIRHASAQDSAFVADLVKTLGNGPRVNHVGSLYANIIGVLAELPDSLVTRLKLDREAWAEKLNRIMGEGEVDHYEFFKALFMGRHEGFGSVGRIWDLPIDDANYPVYSVPVNPTAFVGHENQIPSCDALGMAWLGNLHYWITLCLLDYSYRNRSASAVDLSRAQKLGPVMAIAQHLPTLGYGMPFDALSMGYAPGVTPQESSMFVLHLCQEADRLAHALAGVLPDAYPMELAAETMDAIERDTGCRI